MFLCKEVSCFENLQLAGYCVNFRKIPGYCCKRSAFFDCGRNMRHFLCGVEKVKRFVNIRLHWIVRNLKKISKMSTLTTLEKFLPTPVVAY